MVKFVINKKNIMNNKFFSMTLIILLTLQSLFACAQQGIDYNKSTDLVYDAFKAKNYKMLKPLLDPNVKIGDLPKGMNDMIIPQIIDQMPKPQNYKITKSVKEGTNTRVYTDCTLTDNEKYKWTFLFNKEGKIIELDVLGDGKSQME